MILQCLGVCARFCNKSQGAEEDENLQMGSWTSGCTTSTQLNIVFPQLSVNCCSGGIENDAQVWAPSNS